MMHEAVIGLEVHTQCLTHTFKIKLKFNVNVSLKRAYK